MVGHRYDKAHNKCRLVYVVIVLDWYTKRIVGHYSGKQARTAEWLEALNKALNREFPEGMIIKSSRKLKTWL